MSAHSVHHTESILLAQGGIVKKNCTKTILMGEKIMQVDQKLLQSFVYANDFTLTRHIPHGKIATMRAWSRYLWQKKPCKRGNWQTRWI